MRILVVGPADERLLKGLLRAAGSGVSHEVIEAPERFDHVFDRAVREADHVLVVVPWPREEAAGVGPFDIVRFVTSTGRTAGVVTSHATADFVGRALGTAASPIVELAGETGHVDDALNAAVDRWQRRRVGPPSGSFEIGSDFHGGGDAASYEESRSLSLQSPSMQEFLDELGQAVRDMVARSDRTPEEREGWSGLVMPRPAWDDGVPGRWWPKEVGLPAGLRPTTKRSARPTIEDLLSYPEHEETRRLLRSDAAGRAESAGYGDWPPAILIRGESGTGKSLVAHLIRGILDREKEQLRPGENPTWDMPHVDVNCGGMGVAGFDHEMFGSAGGIWTDIRRPVVGALARAAYGTVFLDEIGDMSWDSQARLLRYLDNGLVAPTGVDPFPGFTRILAATNCDLESMIERREFRHDLLARFSVQVTIPPLRRRSRSERRRLVDFVAQNPRYNPGGPDGREVTHIAPTALEELLAAEFAAGNFRELERTVHAGLRRARRSGSRVLLREHVDLVGREDLTSAGDVVRLRDPLTPTSREVRVASESDLRLIAAMSSGPVLHEPSGSLAVPRDGVVYRWAPE